MDDIDDYSFFASSIGNAFFSGLSKDEIWSCISLASNCEEFDAAIHATIKMKESFAIANRKRNKA